MRGEEHATNLFLLSDALPQGVLNLLLLLLLPQKHLHFLRDILFGCDLLSLQNLDLILERLVACRIGGLGFLGLELFSNRIDFPARSFDS